MRAAECQLRDTWKVIQLERDADFEHRAPQRRKAPMPITEQMTRPRSCLLTGDGRGGFAPVEGALPPLAAGESAVAGLGAVGAAALGQVAGRALAEDKSVRALHMVRLIAGRLCAHGSG